MQRASDGKKDGKKRIDCVLSVSHSHTLVGVSLYVPFITCYINILHWEGMSVASVSFK